MDNFSYKYIGLDNLPEPSSAQKSNRLDYVHDSGTDYVSGSVPVYDDIKTDQETENYKYDKLGQLTHDETEGIFDIEWFRGSKKVKKIIRSDGDSPEVEFIYNPFGTRILKILKPRSGGNLSTSDEWNYTFYAYDANGQNMAMYETYLNTSEKDVRLKEQNIYGVQRIGLISTDELIWSATNTFPVLADVNTNTLGLKNYEISNYIGNVNAVNTDRKILSSPGAVSSYEAVVVMKSDYYPFGMQMPAKVDPITGNTIGGNWNSSEYRYGYNGMEADDEVKGTGNSYTTEFRQYDSRLGRWLSLDPVTHAHQSPFCGMDNNPIFFNDPKGDDVEIKGTRKERRDLRRMIRYGRRNDAGFNEWYKERKKQPKENTFSFSDNEAHTKGGNHFKQVMYRGPDTPLIEESEGTSGRRSHVLITIDDEGKENFTHGNERRGEYYFSRLPEATQQPLKVGISFGIRLYNFVLIDIQLNRVGRWESYFPGRKGIKKPIAGFYIIGKDSEAYQSYPSGMIHPVFFGGKEWLIPCLHFDRYFIGMGGEEFINELPPDKPILVIDVVRNLYIQIRNRIFRRYIWTP